MSSRASSRAAPLAAGGAFLCRVEGPDSNGGQPGPSPGIPQSPEGMTPVWSGEILTALVRHEGLVQRSVWAAEPLSNNARSDRALALPERKRWRAASKY
jgi:hypothetical protein